jgi:hypothetical protein
LTAGTTYRFILTAENEYGPSDYSEELRAAMGELPPAPAKPYKVEVKSTLNSIYVKWTAVTPIDTVAVTGYILSMDDGMNGNFI